MSIRFRTRYTLVPRNLPSTSMAESASTKCVTSAMCTPSSTTCHNTRPVCYQRVWETPLVLACMGDNSVTRVYGRRLWY